MGVKQTKVLVVFGTRPEAVKMAPLVHELRKHPEFDAQVCVTAQHRQMLDQVLDIFEIKPQYDLNIMTDRQTLESITTKAIEGLSQVYEAFAPDVVLVHGDTTTTFAGSLAAFYKHIRVGHVEAGLRTYDNYFPYPEEVNRRLTGVIADLHFSPTPVNRQNLINERTAPEKIFITGNTVIDALKTTVRENYIFQNDTLKTVDFKGSRVICVTAHRRENLGQPLREICTAIRWLVENYSDISVVYPVHLNPAVREVAHEILGGLDRVYLIDPVDVEDMHNLMAQSYMIMTDSGGLQEEAPALGKPVLVLRNETERPEAVTAGTVKIAGTKCENIKTMAAELLDAPEVYQSMAKAVNPYGDGNASVRIAQALKYTFGYTDERPQDFLPEPLATK